MWTLSAGASGWVKPHPAVALSLEPGFRLVHYFTGDLMIEPAARLGIGLVPVDILEIDLAAWYRYYSFSLARDQRFHEPGAGARLELGPGPHEIFLGYSVFPRFMPGLEGGREIEHEVRLGWSVRIQGILGLGIQASYGTAGGSESWMRYDAATGKLGLDVEWRILDAGASYEAGPVWYGGGIGLSHSVEAWIGVTAPGWLRVGLSYVHERLDRIRHLTDDETYARHQALLVVGFAWGISNADEGPGAGGEGHDLDVPGWVETGEGGIEFAYRDGEAGAVSVVGSFDGWDEEWVMEGPDQDGLWTLELEVGPGLYEFLYMVDGEAVSPPGVQLVLDGMGGRNGLVLVGE